MTAMLINKDTEEDIEINDIRDLVDYINTNKYIVESIEFYETEFWEHLQYIKIENNETEKIYLAAVKSNGWAIRYIDAPSEKVQLEGVKKNSSAIIYIKNLSNEIILTHLKNHGTVNVLKGWFKSKEMLIEAVNIFGDNNDFYKEILKNQTVKDLKEILDKNWE